MLKNRNLSADVRRRVTAPHRIVIATDAANLKVVHVDPTCRTRILAVRVVYAVASDTGSLVQLNVGTMASAALYADITLAVSQAAGTVASATILSTAALPAGTTLVVRRESGAATNTGEVDVFVEYEILDRTVSNDHVDSAR